MITRQIVHIDCTYSKRVRSHKSTMLTILFLIINIYSPCTSYAQDQELPPLEALESSIIKFTNQECKAKLLTQNELKDHAWKELLPSLGVAYTPSGSPRPSASWSPLQILDRSDAIKKRKLDKQSILLSYELIVSERLYKLRQLYNDHEIDRRTIETKQVSLEIDEELFAITASKYQENIIKPSEYLKAKKAILEHRGTIEIYLLELQKQVHQILYEARWDDVAIYTLEGR